jgi:hypothetical protein
MSEFWDAVKELVGLRKHVPEERRATSAVREAVESDLTPEEIEHPYKVVQASPETRSPELSPQL